MLRRGALEISANDASPVKTINSRSEQETKQLAGQLLLKHWDALAVGPIVIGLDGPLGAGKTVFAKGVAQFLGLTTPITSPTYTYIEEYDFIRHQTKGKFFHLDMWKVDSAAQFERLEFAPLLQPRTVIVIEWWDQVKGYVLPLLGSKPLTLIQCTMLDVHNGTDRYIEFDDQMRVSK
jgi:tRNA threonylcarbamoyladenosine biosynthesis protein TsaE